MSKFAEDTSVSVEKTRAELETVLNKFGATSFGYLTEPGRAIIGFRFHDKNIRFFLPLPSPTENRFTEYKRGEWGSLQRRTPDAARSLWEQACRSAWRALFNCVKFKLVAVDCKITSFEEEFLAHVVLPDGRTAGEMMIPQIDEAYKSGLMPRFTLALPHHSES